MSKSQNLRVLVNKRLTAAAEEIFKLFEKTIAEYEEELSLSKQENQRKQALLDSVMNPKVELQKAGPHDAPSAPSPPQPEPKFEIVQIKEEPELHSIKQEEEQLPVPVPGYSAITVKVGEFMLETENKAERKKNKTEGGTENSSDSEGETENSSDTDNSSDFEYEGRGPSSSFTPRKDHNYQVQNRGKAAPKSGPPSKYKYKSAAPEASTSVNENKSGTEGEKHQCSECKRQFPTAQQLQVHYRVHTIKKNFSCTLCNRTFSCKASLDIHVKQHTNKNSYSCPVCNKVLSSKTSVIVHARQHKGNETFSCSVCNKTFAQMCILQLHMRMHSNELQE